MLTTIVLVALVRNSPAADLLEEDGAAAPERVGWLTPVLEPVAFAMAYSTWMWGVKRYHGASG